MDEQTVNRLSGIFEPFWTSRRQSFKKSKGRFVHYTSADSAIKIIQTKSIWMRNARCMNDYREISHGHDLLLKLFHEREIGKNLEDVIDCHKNGLLQEVFKSFDFWWNNIQSNTFICSISEHGDSEDQHGRLSMWRAYGHKSAKAAVVFNAPFEPRNAAKGLSCYLRPALYFTEDQLRDEIKHIISNIDENADLLSALDPQIIAGQVFIWLLLTTVCLKHDGFKEEREWRVIYLPQLRSSKFMLSDIETVQGIPQLVYKIPLREVPDEDIVAISVPQLIERIIIGPTEYPYPLLNAFVLELERAGVKDAANRVIISGIPLRT